MQHSAIIVVVIITVFLRPTSSPIQPMTNPPMGLRTKAEQKVKAENNWATKRLSCGKNNVLRITAICMYSIKTKYSRMVPI